MKFVTIRWTGNPKPWGAPDTITGIPDGDSCALAVERAQREVRSLGMGFSDACVWQAGDGDAIAALVASARFKATGRNA